jgi:hypothetical protein
MKHPGALYLQDVFDGHSVIHCVGVGLARTAQMGMDSQLTLQQAALLALAAGSPCAARPMQGQSLQP